MGKLCCYINDYIYTLLGCNSLLPIDYRKQMGWKRITGSGTNEV